MHQNCIHIICDKYLDSLKFVAQLYEWRNINIKNESIILKNINKPSCLTKTAAAGRTIQNKPLNAMERCLPQWINLQHT